MKKISLLFIPLMFFFGCEEDNPPQAVLMNDCGIVNLSIDNGEVVEFFNGENPELGYDCSMAEVAQTTEGGVCNVAVRIELYNDSGEARHYLYFDGFKEPWGEFPNVINNPFVPCEIHFDDYENLAVYEAENDGVVNYTIDYNNQTISGDFNINIEPYNQAQNNPININGNFSGIPFILYTQ